MPLKQVAVLVACFFFCWPNAENHRLPKAAERGTRGAAFGSPREFSLLGDFMNNRNILDRPNSDYF